MIDVLQALWPLFVLIVTGFYMQKHGFPGREFWPGAERFNYFVLFPALLFKSLASAPLDNPALPRLLVAVALALAACCVGLLIARRVHAWPAARFGVMLQGTLRFNTYLGLAAIGGFFGKEGLLLAAVMLALLVPTVNVLSVLALSAGCHTSAKSLLRPIAKNPLILACAAGALLNLSGIEIKWGADRLLALLAASSLPLGLLCVGAALKPGELRGELKALLANSLSRLLLVPAVAFACAVLLGLPANERAILVLFFALPTAPTAYVLTRQLGGDAHLMAGIITLQTLLSALSLMLVLILLG
ncbi:AEC family transporter [Azoarcus sp. L1K30]|uniref:AEC family transporter n=1 Tax=Azoarcus sp. L1K30 TaxID=2820277 RepID=UPI001B81F9F2|nr:AEC family transporter [Azoarcus sp. L1K30]MBR0565450.1 AEC family transporter [Azoarcus sp. L1K30]